MLSFHNPRKILLASSLVFVGVGSCESMLKGINIVSVIILPCGLLVDKLFAGLLDELFGLRSILLPCR